MKILIHPSTFQLLRIKFSFLLMPIYWFAISQINVINLPNTVLIFIILHLLVYPASNGYNSFMDKDKGSIGLLKNPLQPTRQLFYVTIFLDFLALILSLFISFYFFFLLLLYIAASRAYSYRGIRLKKYPIISFIVAIVFQGAVVYAMVYHGSNVNVQYKIPFLPMIASTLLVGSFYPLTQIYQHNDDKQDGVKTISMVLGYKGTFIFSGIMYFLAMLFMGSYFALNLELDRFLVLLLCMIPSLLFFIWWFLAVNKNNNAANFKNSMVMNWVAACSNNVGFLIILILKEKF